MTTTTTPQAPELGGPPTSPKSSAHSGAFCESVAFRLRLRRLPRVEIMGGCAALRWGRGVAGCCGDVQVLSRTQRCMVR
jgi:hypothetical protein